MEQTPAAMPVEIPDPEKVQRGMACMDRENKARFVSEADLSAGKLLP